MNDNRNKIIALPFAGGNRYSFNSIEKYVPKNLNWVTLESPGRGNRFREDLLVTVNELVDDLLNQIIPLIENSNYVIYGHSMGTLLGYELTKKIIEKKLKQPTSLFFTGRGAPGFSRFDTKKSLLPETVFWKEVEKIGGLPQEILQCKELLELYYPIMKSDFKAIEDYEFLAMEKPFSIPIHVCMGKDEIGRGEEKTSLNDMKAWQNETSLPCTFELLEGDHFFIFKHAEAIAKKISRTAVTIGSTYA
ncbi:thioesterase II family protein [Flavobacterium collinsii]|uniref:Thioesterase involved in non-ribosomal peptide biosynthesis n=1 Tax=Flavobacterium collinsii TaxID=1114861 RepID=A0A9W4X397_9FLAO|nr:thioesterase domain-containing protein [Flavobacterium collinsii]GIQ61011.1 thioesterase [Flavobacterium collinsii]CAI2767099.1 thioesterase involved in non-ribosomal peptide biosynthesis [Flavobacterium collinsii]